MSYSLAFSQAIMIVIYVADKVEQKMYDFVPTAQLSETLSIPRPTAVKILGSLSGAGIIETREGAKGGVRLAVPPADVTVLHIFEAIDAGKPLFREDFQLRATGIRPTRAQEEVQSIFNSAEIAMKTRLGQSTIAGLLELLNEG
jgi:Rrf2 family protein